MFWGSFSGPTKVPYLLWHKEWGTVDQQPYGQRVVPLIGGWLRMNPTSQLVRDGALAGHTGGNIEDHLRERAIFWPACSPDQNPMKGDYLEQNGRLYCSTLPRKAIVRPITDSNTRSLGFNSVKVLQGLIAELPERCQLLLLQIEGIRGSPTTW